MPDFPAAHSVLLEAICDRAFPGAAYGVLLRGRVLTIAAAGRFTYDFSSPEVQPYTVFDMASVSKVMATTAAAMLLWERGQLDLDEAISKRLPEFVAGEPADSPKRAITPRMLLAHSSGLPAYLRLYELCRTPQALMEAALHVPLEAVPDTRAVYSDIGFIVLGHYLELLTGERLDTFCQREIFAPLEMGSTGFCPLESQRTAIPPTRLHDPLRNRMVQGEVHDNNCWVLGGVSGHAGIFSNVADTLRFAGCVLGGGAPLFRPQTIALFTARQQMPAGTSRALGWDTPSRRSSSGSYFSQHSAGHLGYTGTSLWIDFERCLAVALLTNRTFPGDGAQGISDKIQQVRPRFHDAILRELRLDSL
jgi:serine-type D-Ala-D-Ala carboxypeptidase